MNTSRWIDTGETEKHEDKLLHYYFTTYAFWISILATVLHITLYNPGVASVITDAAFAIAFGVAVVGTLISCNWGKKLHKIWGFFNLVTHILPFVCILTAVLKYRTPTATVWKTIVLAWLAPLMYDFSCGDRSESLYQKQSSATKKMHMVPILASVITCGVFARSFIGR